jgi:hypothetical protein
MPILNYTTSVSASRTANELQGLLGDKGAKRVSVDYNNDGDPIAIEFMITLVEQPVWFRLPCNVEGVHQALLKQGTKIDRKYRTWPQAQRVAWRIVKDWVEAQLAIVEARQAEMVEVFLPYVIDRDGQSMFQRFKEAQQKQLTSGSVVEGNFQTGTR